MYPNSNPKNRSFIYRHRVAIFFVLGYALVWAVWSTTIAEQLGIISLHIPNNPGYYGLPVAALLVAWLAEGREGVLDIVRRMFRWRITARWYLIGTGVPIALSLIGMGMYRLIGVAPQVGVMLPLGGVGLYMLGHGIFFWGTEELAWRGFALPRLQHGRSALSAALILGLVWAIWHTPLFLMTTVGQSAYPYVGFLLFTIAESVLMTWIYNNTGGSVLMACIVHTASDGSLLYTGALSGDHLCFWVTVAVYCVAALVVVLVEGTQHLSHRRSQLTPAETEQVPGAPLKQPLAGA